jgi:phosphate transport system permease protein
MDTTPTVLTTAEEAEPIREFRSGRDFFRVFCWIASAATVGTLIWIGVELFMQAWPAIQKLGLEFITSAKWVPNREKFGVLSFIIGTAASSAIALLIAFPLGVAISIFLSENFLALKVRQVVRFVVELLAAIPSVVYGLWGIFVVIPLVQKYCGGIAETLGGTIPFLKGPVYGNSLFTASIVLALMVLPTITAISRNSLVAVPKTLREGAYALGATRWEAIFGVILPTAAPGIVAATILAFGRAMGETMAVAMLIGNSTRMPDSVFGPGGTLAGLMANNFAEAGGLQVNALMYSALVLVVLTLGVNMAGEAVLRITQKRTAGIQ